MPRLISGKRAVENLAIQVLPSMAAKATADMASS
jgi:hypothetical protein